MRITRVALVLSALLVMGGSAIAQGVDIPDIGTISGSLQTDVSQYNPDSTINAPDVPENILSNTFVNILFTRGGFTAGLRFESYQNPLLGIDPRFGTTGAGTGIGIPYRFATYATDGFEVTAGNFYEQFGSGMVLRLYEERNLGFDNSIDGLRLRFMPVDGVKITGFIGRQRSFFNLSEGIMRGADATIDLKELGLGLPDDVFATVGASVVSRYQADQDPFLNLPENVLAWSGRGNIGVGDFQLEAEYAYKINDPGVTNRLSFNTGNAVYVNASYATSGIGLSYAIKRIDNMDFRSDRTATGFVQQVNYLPALTKQHTWRLITLYPYATQPTGEFGQQVEGTFTIPKKSFLGDDETNIIVNFSQINALDTTRTDAFSYVNNSMSSSRVFFRDFNIEIVRKFGHDFKITLSYIDLLYDQDVIEGRAAINESKFGVLHPRALITELWFKTGRGQAFRTELQWMTVGYESDTYNADGSVAKYRERDPVNNGDWAMVLAEYSISPTWFFTVFTEVNYNRTALIEDANDELVRVEADNIIYPSATIAWVKDALRVQGGYGRIRGGILCVGGICRPVPASNGFSLGVQYTF